MVLGGKPVLDGDSVLGGDSVPCVDSVQLRVPWSRAGREVGPEADLGGLAGRGVLVRNLGASLIGGVGLEDSDPC